METIKRYVFGYCGVEECEDGDWCRWDDVEKILKENEELRLMCSDWAANHTDSQQNKKPMRGLRNS